MNLLEHNFQASPVISRLFRFDSVEYRGEIASKVQRFDARREGEGLSLIVTTIIRKDEGLIWKSCEDLLDHAVKTAAAGMQGLFGFDLISFDLGAGIGNFNWTDFAALLVNKSRKLEVGGSVLVQYGSLFGILKKRVKEDWGKIDLHTSVEVFGKEPEQFDLCVNRLIKVSSEIQGPKILVILDLSAKPVFKFGLADQTERLHKLLEKQRNSGPDREIFDIYVIQKTGTIELFAQFNVY